MATGTDEDRRREEERERLRWQEEQDLEVEQRRGERPLEGFSAAPTSWPRDTDDRAAAREHASDAKASWEESVDQARRLAPAK